MTMSNAGTPDLPARRRDEFSDWHDLVPASCDGCGCTYFFAKDDPAIVWEPERAWDEGCPDRECHCHTQALIGQRKD
jgi:hypothetical protein